MIHRRVTKNLEEIAALSTRRRRRFTAGQQAAAVDRARFLTADAVDAMIPGDPRQPGVGAAKARQTILAGSGKDFDPDVVRAFAAIPDQEWVTIADELERYSPQALCKKLYDGEPNASFPTRKES